MKADSSDFDTPLFTVEQTAHAIGRSFQLIKKWQGARILLIRPKDVPGSAGRGRRALFTLRTVTTLALMAEMTAWGVPAEIAYNSATEFTNFGEGPPAGYAGTRREDPRDGRGMFTSGETWLVVFNQREPAELLNVHVGTPFMWPQFARAATLLINCEIILKDVIGRLNAYEGPT